MNENQQNPVQYLSTWKCTHAPSPSSSIYTAAFLCYLIVDMVAYLLLLICATLGMALISGNVPGPDLGPVYTLQKFIRRDVNLANRKDITDRLNLSETIMSSNETHFDWEGYDGWYNNPAHPEWGGAGK